MRFGHQFTFVNGASAPFSISFKFMPSVSNTVTEQLSGEKYDRAVVAGCGTRDHIDCDVV